MSRQTRHVEVCDNADCNRTSFTAKDEPALGIYLKGGVQHQSWGGGPIPKTYACSMECIVPAIVANLYRADGRDPITGEWER